MSNPLNILSEDTFAEKMDVKNSYLAIIADKINLPIDAGLSDTSENPVQNKAVKTALDAKLDISGGTMSGNLGMNGKDILNVKKIIFDLANGEWLNMSNHPITNLATPTAEHHAVTKKYVDDELDGKLNNVDGAVKYNHLSDGCIAWNHIGNGQITTPALAEKLIYTRHIVNKNVTEEKLSDDVAKKLNSGVKQINKITLDETTQGALSIKITQDNLGNAFSLSNAVITAHLNIDISQKVGTQFQIRIVANKGRFLFFKSGLTIRHYADIIVNSNYDENTGMTFNVGSYVWTDTPYISTGSTSSVSDPSLCNIPDGNAPISEVEVMVIDLGNNQRLPLLSGSFLNIKGE